MNRTANLEDISYRLAPGIRMRKEGFGLLFYDFRGPRLVFVHSGEWIQPEFFLGNNNLGKWLLGHFPAMSEEKILDVKKKLSSALARLVEKGLIVEVLRDT